MKKYLSLFLLIQLFFSCNNVDLSNKYTQFNSDDLSFLYYNSDTLDFTGRTIKYEDTITFLLNRTEVTRVRVVTDISSFRSPPWDTYHEAGIQAESNMEFNEETGFIYTTVGVSRQYIDDIGSERYFYVSVKRGYSFSKFFYINDKIPLDTALVLGIYYDNVIKFEPDSLLNTNIKSIYFAKKFGFIKIETLDGKTMERVLPGNLGIGY